MDSKILKRKLVWIVFSAILLLGAGLRLSFLSWSPPSLNWDEAALGYNAYSLMKTARDEYGNFLPLALRSFEDYKPALYAYLTIPFVKVLGLNEVAVRMTSALAGVLAIISVFLITAHFFSKRVALLASALIAVEPWAVHFSRAAFEANLGNGLFLFGIALGLKAEKRPPLLFLSLLVLGLSAYAYHSPRLLLVPVLVALLWNARKVIQSRGLKIKLAALTLTFLLPLAFLFLSGRGTARLEWTSLLRVWMREESTPSSFVNNSYYLLAQDFTGRYLSYFSPANLFVRGTPEPNQKTPGFAPFYGIEFFFWLAGLFLLAKRRFKPRFFTFLILLAPLPAAITWNWFSLVRTLLLLSLFPIVTALGLSWFIDLMKNKSRWIAVTSLGILLLLFINNTSSLAATTFFIIPFSEKGTWQYGFRETMNYVAPIADKYDRIIYDVGHAKPYIFILFYSQYPPQKYHRWRTSNSIEGEPEEHLDKYIFRRIKWPEDKNLKNTLFIGSPETLADWRLREAENATLLEDLKDIHGGSVGRVVEIK